MTTIKSTVKIIPVGFFTLLHKLGFKSAADHIDKFHITVALDLGDMFPPGAILKINGDSEEYVVKDVQ